MKTKLYVVRSYPTTYSYSYFSTSNIVRDLLTGYDTWDRNTEAVKDFATVSEALHYFKQFHNGSFSDIKGMRISPHCNTLLVLRDVVLVPAFAFNRDRVANTDTFYSVLKGLQRVIHKKKHGSALRKAYGRALQGRLELSYPNSIEQYQVSLPVSYSKFRNKDYMAAQVGDTWMIPYPLYELVDGT